MPFRMDGTGKRWVEMDVLVPGTPEQVWQALATSNGNAAWFTAAAIEGKIGGVLRFDFGGDMTSSGTVTAWEPPLRFGYLEFDWAEGAPPLATEITITARSGGQCLIRMVHSLFTSSDDWDDQMEGFEGGWPGFFDVLRVYLPNFAGMNAASFMAVTSARADHLPTWMRLLDSLKLAGANVGEHRSAALEPERLSGVVARVHLDARQRYILLHLDGPHPGIVLLGTYAKGESINVSVCRYHYGDDAAAALAVSEPRWREWLTASFGK